MAGHVLREKADEGPHKETRKLRLPSSPWLALLLLFLLFELPVALEGHDFRPLRMRPSGDLLLLLTVYSAGYVLGYGWTKWLAISGAAALMIFRLDRVIFTAILTDEPLLYDQLFMLRHAFVLAHDLASIGTLLVIAGSLSAIVATIWLAGRCLSVIRPLISPNQLMSTARTGFLAWLCFIAATMLSWASPTMRPFVTWEAPSLVANIAKSRHIWNSVKRGLTKSPYRAFDSIRLERKPNIRFFVVESYGRVLNEHHALKRPYHRMIATMESRLTQAGYHSVSSYTQAPVRGGRSWLADGTLLIGANVHYEAVFAQVSREMARIPHLISFLNNQGYYTVAMSPSDRARPGVSRPDNKYGFDRSLTFDDLNYRGPALGWGIVPDQYSLGFVNEHVLKTAPRPNLLWFHMVSSHAPWKVIPTIQAEWRNAGTLREGTSQLPPPGSNPLQSALRLFEHHPRPEAFREFTPLRQLGYQNAIAYDLELLTRFLEEDQSDTIAVVLGDHQPPVVASDTASFDTPIHVIARDSGLLNEWRHRGFVDGLSIAPKEKAAVRHEGIFSLFVRALTACCSTQPTLPKYHPRGYPLLDEPG